MRVSALAAVAVAISLALAAAAYRTVSCAAAVAALTTAGVITAGKASVMARWAAVIACAVRSSWARSSRALVSALATCAFSAATR